MPWQTCLVCPRYPFPSLLLLDPPALWQPSLPVNRTAKSHATPLQHHRSPLPDHTHQSQRQALSGLTTVSAVGNDEGLELDKTDKDEKLCEGDEEPVEEDEGEDVGGIQCGGGR